jgi:hypothetical protein
VAGERISTLAANLSQAASILENKACVYATGSFGRLEASSHSDLDLFIVGLSRDDQDSGQKKESRLSRLDEIVVKADLIQAVRNLSIPDFDGDGRYLIHYSVSALTETLGRADDDATNTFTARLLLLLESRPLLQPEVYRVIIQEVIAAYWRDFADHKDDFVPAFLANDILRLWRTFCVNYEAGTLREPAQKKARGKLKNYKLKHSRMLTCYSALLYMLIRYQQYKTVSPDHIVEMTSLTPTQRLERIKSDVKSADSKRAVGELLKRYDSFLQKTNQKESALVDIFMDKKKTAKFVRDAYAFGDQLFEVISLLGDGGRFHRMLVV